MHKRNKLRECSGWAWLPYLSSQGLPFTLAQSQQSDKTSWVTRQNGLTGSVLAAV
ncbi:hypothetical protein HanHA300_Chr09g0301401 [Helianthus annuus]|nr:hypothetical protein HanHA300_Chr09g0301401 [Helianthus annuus]KAJ0540755.1 hypothetical protein HanHA89_Chr09g0320481 [Helianthus annuus]KAJ0705862.1 hypothetical protein HanLR1_Chr09g0300281 [Helianthus annuus]